MSKYLFKTMSAVLVAGALFTTAAKAEIIFSNGVPQTSHAKVKRVVRHAAIVKSHRVKAHHVAVANVRTLRHAKPRHSQQARALPANRQRVVALITSMAPRYGVPTWFALKIARIESSYNPNARGAAGEYGVYQLKCATARGIGFRGNCGALLNASTNVQFGLKHLSMAVRSSRGNLRLAASKHNGGLGRRSIVRAYVRRVF
jgi:soluble lytic murein transglycosylase-like protein